MFVGFEASIPKVTEQNSNGNQPTTVAPKFNRESILETHKHKIQLQERIIARIVHNETVCTFFIDPYFTN